MEPRRGYPLSSDVLVAEEKIRLLLMGGGVPMSGAFTGTADGMVGIGDTEDGDPFVADGGGCGRLLLLLLGIDVFRARKKSNRDDA